jgi:proteic killer suppression protein
VQLQLWLRFADENFGHGPGVARHGQCGQAVLMRACNLCGDGLHTVMIVSFRHKGLKLLFEKGDRRRVLSEHVSKVERILARLDEASEISNMDLPGFRLHPLKGDLVGRWSVTVSGNWRIVFRFEAGNAADVDLVDYH